MRSHPYRCLAIATRAMANVRSAAVGLFRRWAPSIFATSAGRCGSMKRSPLKPKSSEQARMERKHRLARQGFRFEFPSCWFCGRPTTDVHELTANGSCRSQAYGERCCWAASCNWCNCHRLTDKCEWPIARQLAVKWINDRVWFNLDRFNEIRRGLPRTAWADVAAWICREVDRWQR